MVRSSRWKNEKWACTDRNWESSFIHELREPNILVDTYFLSLSVELNDEVGHTAGKDLILATAAATEEIRYSTSIFGDFKGLRERILPYLPQQMTQNPERRVLSS